MKIFIILEKYTLTVLVAMVLLVLGSGSVSALMQDHECAYCHQTHNAPGFTLLSQSGANLVLTAELVCLTCHGPTGSSSLTADVHDGNNPNYSYRISCIECHDPHDHQENINGVDNLNMVLGTITVMPDDINAVFADKDKTDGSWDYSKPDGSGICQVCHTQTTQQSNDGARSDHPKNQPDGTLCASCHPHSNGFDK